MRRVRRSGGILLTTYGMVLHNSAQLGARRLTAAEEAEMEEEGKEGGGKGKGKKGGGNKINDTTTEERALALAALRRGRFRGPFAFLNGDGSDSDGGGDTNRRGSGGGGGDAAALVWDWCVCDEGHKLKNPAMQLVRRLRGVPCLRTLILSGTPIQNNLMELWALFDVVTPGLLGPAREFKGNFERKIVQGQCREASAREQEARTRQRA